MPFTFLSTSQMVDCLSACFVNALASRPSACLSFYSISSSFHVLILLVW